MTRDEIEKQATLAAQLLRQKLDPMAADFLGNAWFTEFQSALADYTCDIAALVYDEAARVAEGDIDPEWPNDDISNHARLIADRIRSLKDSLAP